MVEETEVGVEAVEAVEVVMEAIVVVEVEAAAPGVAVVVVAGVISEVVGTLGAEELAMTAGAVEVAEEEVPENREGTWPFFSVFPPISSGVQCISPERSYNSGRSCYR